jgi:hypothetical protein
MSPGGRLASTVMELLFANINIAEIRTFNSSSIDHNINLRKLRFGTFIVIA